MFVEYYLTFKLTSWLKNVCSSLAHCFTVVNFKICSIHPERNPSLEFAKVISKRSPSREEAHLEKKPIQGMFYGIYLYKI